jgi:ABC-type transport system substrate-binding protein
VPICFVIGVAVIGGNTNSRNYTYRTTTDQWPKDWNPISWQLGVEGTMLATYIGSSFYVIHEQLDEDGNPVYVDLEGNITTPANGVVRGGYQLQDATAWPLDISLEIATRKDASNYGVGLKYKLDEEGKPTSELDLDANGQPQLADGQARKAWRIPVRNDLRWQDGTFITIADYEFTYKTLLSPAFKAYRSNLLRVGNSSVYGAHAYWDQKATPNWQNLGVSWDNVGIEFEYERRAGDSTETMGSIIFVYNGPGEESVQDLVVRWGSPMLLHKETFESNLIKKGDLYIASYNTNVDNTMAWGPYKLVARSDNSYTMERNRYWAVTADMQPRFPDAFQITHVKTDLVTHGATRRLEFLNGNLDEIPLAATDTDLRGSSQRRDVPSSFSMRIYFNFDRESLNKIQSDDSTSPTKVHNPENLQFLANNNFRKAFSLAMNRTALGEAYGPASSASVVLWNELYFLALDPLEQYRFGDDALKALLEREGIDTTNLTNAEMRAAYYNITGYDVDQARELFAKARAEELAALGRPDSDETVTVRFTVYTGTTASVVQQQPMLTQMQNNINAAVPDNLRVEFTLRAAPGGLNRYDELDTGGVESIVGAMGGATVNITSPLRSFLGLSSAKTSGGNDNGGTMGFRPDVETATIDLSPILDNPDVASGDKTAVAAAKLARDVLDYMAINKDYEPKEGYPNLYEINQDNEPNHLTLHLNQWGVLFGQTEKPEEAQKVETTGKTVLGDNINYSFLPQEGTPEPNKDEKNPKRRHAWIGQAVNIYWMRHVQPYLETAILDQYGQVPLVMDVAATLVSFRVATLLKSPDPRFVNGSFRYLKMTVNDGEWAREVANSRAALRELYFL